jgi:hypothetical protein
MAVYGDAAAVLVGGEFVTDLELHRFSHTYSGDDAATSRGVGKDILLLDRAAHVDNIPDHIEKPSQ